MLPHVLSGYSRLYSTSGNSGVFVHPYFEPHNTVFVSCEAMLGNVIRLDKINKWMEGLKNGNQCETTENCYYHLPFHRIYMNTTHSHSMAHR